MNCDVFNSYVVGITTILHIVFHYGRTFLSGYQFQLQWCFLFCLMTYCVFSAVTLMLFLMNLLLRQSYSYFSENTKQNHNVLPDYKAYSFKHKHVRRNLRTQNFVTLKPFQFQVEQHKDTTNICTICFSPSVRTPPLCASRHSRYYTVYGTFCKIPTRFLYRKLALGT